jgi:hypothetical protein
MAYIPGYRYDVFVSYAHVDNIPVAPSEPGWVDALFRQFGLSLDMKLGRQRMAEIWRDLQSLRGNQEVTGHINDQVRQSALLLLVLSPAYLASESCLRELQTFVERGPANRIFVVWKDPSETARQPLPAEIRDLRKYKFWFLDDNQKTRVLGWPNPRTDSAEDRRFYYPVIEDLVADVCETLHGLRAAADQDRGPTTGPGIPVPPPPPRQVPRKGTVLLAEVTGDLDPRREEVRRYLDLAGIDALPTGSYRLTREEFEQAFVADLKSCKAFVQLLGPYASKVPPDVPEGFCRFQLDLARARGVPILQWRSLDLDLNGVAQPAQRALLESDNVQAMPIEEFKRSIVELFAEPVFVPPRPTSFLFVDAANDDVESAGKLVAGLDDSLEWTMPLYDPNDTAEVVQSAAARNLVESDAVVFFYGKANPRWVLSQVDLYRKLKPQRSSNPKLLALVTAPPEPKVAIPIRLQGLKVLPIDEAAAYIHESLGK